MTRARRSKTGRVVKQKKRIHKKKRYLLKLSVLAVLLTGLYFAVHVSYFNIDGIAVIGNEEISDEEIIELSGVREGECLFDVHPVLVERRLMKKNLYIYKVDVDRKLPDKVIINITEKSCKAEIKKDGKYVIIDVDGTVIEITEKSKEATLIENVKIKKAVKREEAGVKSKDTGNYRKSLKIIRAADNNDLFFKKVHVDGDKVKAYIYDELVCEGEYDNLISSIRSGTLKSVVYDLYQKDREKGTIAVSDNDYCFFTRDN